MHRQRHRGLWIAIIWLAIAVINATQNVVGLRGEGVQRPLGIYFAFILLGWMVWACATPLILRITLQYPPVRKAGVRTWLAHLGTFLAISVANSLWGAVLLAAVRPWGPVNDSRSFAAGIIARLISQFHLSLIVYAGIVAIGHTIESRRRNAELSAQLSSAQLDALRRQIEPHFLFNTLNAISGLVRDQRNQDAVGMIAGLSDLLRRVLEDQGRQQVPLGEEMEFLERYIDIQRARFAERLRVAIDVPTELHTAQVPGLILQPLVENAVQHGIGPQVEGGLVRISAARNGSAITMRVFNDGSPLASSWKPGIGIANSRARLENLYGGEAELVIQNCEGGVESLVTIPLRMAPQ